MTPDSMANGVEEQKLLLKQYLGQYYYAKMKKKQLEASMQGSKHDKDPVQQILQRRN